MGNVLCSRMVQRNHSNPKLERDRQSAQTMMSLGGLFFSSIKGRGFRLLSRGNNAGPKDFNRIPQLFHKEWGRHKKKEWKINYSDSGYGRLVSGR